MNTIRFLTFLVLVLAGVPVGLVLAFGLLFPFMAGFLLVGMGLLWGWSAVRALV